MKTVIIGGSAGLGRALANELAADGHDLFIVSSDERDLTPVVSDLKLRYKIQCYCKSVDLNNIDVNELRHTVLNYFNTIDNLFIVAGFSPSTAAGPINDDLAKKILEVNMSSEIRIVNSFLDILEEGKGNIVGIGSTASVRPRRNNSIYGSSKKGLEFYFGTLRHYLYNKNCHIQFYRIGYLDTSMTKDMKLLLPKANPKNVAKNIVKNLGKNRQCIYEPHWWKWIMFIFNILPRFIFNRISV